MLRSTIPLRSQENVTQTQIHICVPVYVYFLKTKKKTVRMQAMSFLVRTHYGSYAAFIYKNLPLIR